ncbi:MAG: hypothetical protein ACREPH_12150 [Rhodanobacteraceae bacterium]
MKQHLIAFVWLVGIVLLGASAVSLATPPASRGTRHAADVQAQLKDVDAKITAARAHNAALQTQMTQMEQQNTARKAQLQQRDAEIAALQKKLRAAGVPASAGSAGH